MKEAPDEKSELDVNQYLIRTDLAVETKEAMANQQAVPTKEIKGFIEKNEIAAALKSALLILQRKARSYREKRRALFNA